MVNMLGFVFHIVSIAPSQNFSGWAQVTIDSLEIHECGWVLMKLFQKTGGRTDLAVGWSLPSPHIDADADRWYHLFKCIHWARNSSKYFQVSSPEIWTRKVCSSSSLNIFSKSE